MLDVTVCIGTYGDHAWAMLAHARATPSAEALGAPVIHCHARTLAEARNTAVADARTEWVAVLDADDELEPGYLDVAAPHGDVIVPRVRYVDSVAANAEPRRVRVAGHDHAGDCRSDCLADGNFIVVGAPVRRTLFERVGGFRDLPVYEDYDLWVRCWRAGARFAYADGPVYRAHVNPRGRNHSLTAARRRAVEDEIRLHRDPVA